MNDKKFCVRCTRSIDRYAKLCLYCNWDQAAMPPAQPEQPATPAYVPPDNRARNRLLGIAALVSLVIIAFVVGTLIHGLEPGEVKAEQTASTTTQVVTSTPHSPVTLVPTNDSAGAPVLEQPLTSAPAQAPGQDPNDATALPSDQYTALAAQARAQKAAQTATVDPRTLRGSAYEGTPVPRRSAQANPPMASSSNIVKTEALPEYKPLPPDLHLANQATARLMLTVGADGSVKDIDITEPVPGATPQLIAAVQRWRFRPATENGIPVPARVAVTITLHGNNE